MNTKIVFQYQLSLNAGQKYCRMLQGEQHSAILSTFIKLPFSTKIFVLSILSGPFRQVLLYYSWPLLVRQQNAIHLNCISPADRKWTEMVCCLGKSKMQDAFYLISYWKCVAKLISKLL